MNASGVCFPPSSALSLPLLLLASHPSCLCVSVRVRASAQEAFGSCALRVQAYLCDLQSGTVSKRAADKARYRSTATTQGRRCVSVLVCLRHRVWVCVRQNITLGQTWLLLLRLCPNCRAGKQMAMNAVSPLGSLGVSDSHKHKLSYVYYNSSPLPDTK